MKKKKIMAMLLTAVLGVSMLAGCSGSSSESASDDSAEETTEETAEEETEEAEEAEEEEAEESASSASSNTEDLVMLISVADESFNDDIMSMVEEEFGDQYNLIIKTWNGNDDLQTIKAAALAGEQIDLCMWWPNSMNSFIEADLAVPLDDYMTDEWKSRFAEGALELGTFDGVLYNLPYSTVYPLVIVNKDLADEAGVTLSEDGKWTWEEFLAFCEAVEENTDAYGSAIASGFAAWLTRNSWMQIWETEEELEAFCAGEVEITSDEIVAASELVNNAFVDNVFYPGGEAALALETDEANAAVATNKAASVFTVNSMAASVIEETGLENYVIMDWPTMGPNEIEPVLGGSNGYFIPSTVKNIDGAVAVLDYLTSEECSNVRAEQGCVTTITVSEDADVDEELMSLISRCSDQIHKEICDVITTISTYIGDSMPANYYFYGEEALTEMEELRLEYWEEQE